MRKASFLVFGLLFLSMSKPVHAAIVISQGKAEVHVQTDTETGEGSTVYTHVETNINGNREVFDSSKSGKMDVDIKSDDKGSVTTTSGNVENEAFPSNIHEKVEQKENFVKTVFEDIKNFFKNIFHLL